MKKSKPTYEIPLHLRPWLTTPEAAAVAGVCENTIRAWLRDGLRVSVIGGRIKKIKREWLDQYIENHAPKFLQGDLETMVDDTLKDLVKKVS